MNLPNDIWQDPRVKAALKDGRVPTDIMVLNCPACGRFGYYNQGSRFWCRFCERSWYCCCEGEAPPLDGAYLWLDMDGPISLADTITDTTEGYCNETRSQPRKL